MTRRTAFNVAVQALGAGAGAIIVLPAVGFALAPLFDEEGDTWQAVGPVSAFDEETYRSVVITACARLQAEGDTDPIPGLWHSAAERIASV